MRCEWSCVLLLGCGRFGFAESGHDADAMVDAQMIDSLDPSLGLLVPFDGSPNDLVGAMASCDPNTCPTYVPGKHGMGALFDGIDDCVQVADTGVTASPALTLALWMNQSMLGEYTPLSKPFLMATTAFDSWQVEDHLTAIMGFTTHNAGRHDVQSVTQPSIGAWHHVAMTFDGVEKLIYVDGALAGSVAEPDPIQYDTSPILIGCDINSGGAVYQYAGVLDDVRVYGRALSAVEIAELAR